MQKSRQLTRKTRIRVSFLVELGPFEQEILDYNAEEHGIEETTRVRRIAKLLRNKAVGEMCRIIQAGTCHKCGCIIKRGDEGYGTEHGECRKCSEAD